jgi:hypothetical protein
VLCLGISGTSVLAEDVLAPDPVAVFEEPGGPVAENWFGYTVAYDQGQILISAVDDDSEERPGVAYLFDVESGDYLGIRFDNPGSPNNLFGYAMAFVGQDVVAIGAPEESIGEHHAGQVYLFNRADGTPLGCVLESQDPVSGGWFGTSLAALGSTIFVGEIGGTAGEVEEAGVAWVMEPDGEDCWTWARVLHKGEPAPSEEFGRSLAVVGQDVVVGARHDGALARQAGAAYLFDLDSTEVLRLDLGAAAQADDMLGSSLAAVGPNVLVGAPLVRVDGDYIGAAYLFDADPDSPTRGELLLTVPNPDPGHLDRFGQAVSSLGSDLLIGAFWDDTNGENAGAAYVFSGDTSDPDGEADLLQVLGKSSPVPGDEFGWSVVDVGGSALIGVPEEDRDGVTEPGRVYLFGNTPPDTGLVELLSDDGTPVSVGFPPDNEGGVTTADSAECVEPGIDYQLCDPPVCLDIRSSVTFSGMIEVCIGFDDGCVPGETSVQLFHDTGAGLEDITTAVYPDEVCGLTDSLSLFVVAAVADADGDGVSDDVDACLETEPGAVVTETGCSVAQLCPCDRSWRNHGAYVSCVSRTVRQLLWSGALLPSEAADLRREAARSSCGMWRWSGRP